MIIGDDGDELHCSPSFKCIETTTTTNVRNAKTHLPVDDDDNMAIAEKNSGK